MAESKFTDLAALASASIDAANDVLPIDDVSVPETKQVTVADLVAAGVRGGVSVANGGFVSIAGAAQAATTGTVRLANGFTIYGRNAADSADYLMMGLDGSNILSIGQSTGIATVLIAAATNAFLRSGTNYFQNAAGTVTRLSATDSGVQFHTSVAAFGSGTKVIGILNATVVPSTNPSGGGILYSEAGAGKWRGSGGTVTTFGPAEPHCPTCGRDFALEHRNDDLGEHFAICIPCMIDEVVRLGADASKFSIVNQRSRTKEDWDTHMVEVRAREAVYKELLEQEEELLRIAAEAEAEAERSDV